MEFFDKNVILSCDEAVELYDTVKDLPIVDYHCHLSSEAIGKDLRFSDIGELWLSDDHYKWRAMRLCGIDEKYITGDADYKEKFLKFASVMPKLCGNPVYYWAQLELKRVFDIGVPLMADTAEEIWNIANEKLRFLSARKILNDFKVEFIATTDDPVDKLEYHGQVGNTVIAPTFRPDKAFSLDADYLSKLEAAADIKIDSAGALIYALEKRLDYFIGKGCKITDHGMSNVPDFCDREEAEKLFARRGVLNERERERMAGFLLCETARLCKKRGIAMQWHFMPLRNVNTEAFKSIGADSGFDVFDDAACARKLAAILDYLNSKANLPKIILYTLNPAVERAVCAISGAFPNIRIGTAWWFNDTLYGIRRHIRNVMEYAAVGVHLGMLTDSRSFTSYVRHDFFRRILCDEVGGLVARGEFDMRSAKTLAADVCYNNVKSFLNI